MTSASPIKPRGVPARGSAEPSDLPPYSEFPQDIAPGDIELARLSRSTSSESLNHVGNSATTTASPTANAAVTLASFVPTVQLQVQCRGQEVYWLPTSPRPDPIPIFSLTADGRIDQVVYQSLRPERKSGSCYLVDGDDATEAVQLTATTYRFGPGKPPQVRLGHPVDPDRDEVFTIESAKGLSRTVAFQTATLGAFQWRYGSKKEREVHAADSLLILERLDATDDGRAPRSSRSGGGGSSSSVVALFVRNELYRTPGSRPSTAGNGGRLLVDLAHVDEKSQEYLQRLIVTTILVMLKKELDRSRARRFMLLGMAIGVLA